MKLVGRKAIVTGGAQGIGFAISTRLNADGARVAILDVNDGCAQTAASKLTDCIGIACDVSRPEQIEAAMERVASEFGGVDILCNNAGILPNQDVFDVTEEIWDRTMAVNLKGMFFMVQKALPLLQKSSCPRIVNISSLAGRMGGFETCMAYSASKGGINALTMGLARRLAPLGITVNAVCPGTTETPITKAFSPEQMERLYARVPLRRLGRPEDIAATVAFLAGEDASFITGHLLDVNGGMYMG